MNDKEYGELMKEYLHDRLSYIQKELTNVMKELDRWETRGEFDGDE